MRNRFSRLITLFQLNVEVNRGASPPAETAPHAVTSAEFGDEPEVVIPLLLDRGDETLELKPHFRKIVEAERPSLGVVLLCGSHEDALIEFVDRVRRHELRELCETSARTTLEVSPAKTPLPRPEVPPFGRGGMLTRWAYDCFGERFNDDGAVLAHLAPKPSLFVASLLVPGNRQAADLDQHLRELAGAFQATSGATDGPPDGAQARLLVFLCCPEGDLNEDRLDLMRKAASPLPVQSLCSFAPVTRLHLEAFWYHVESAKALRARGCCIDEAYARVLDELFGDGVSQVPMRRALSAIRAALRQPATATAS